MEPMNFKAGDSIRNVSDNGVCLDIGEEFTVLRVTSYDDVVFKDRDNHERYRDASDYALVKPEPLVKAEDVSIGDRVRYNGGFGPPKEYTGTVVSIGDYAILARFEGWTDGHCGDQEAGTSSEYWYICNENIEKAPEEPTRPFKVGDRVVGTGVYWLNKGELGVVVQDDGTEKMPFRVNVTTGVNGGESLWVNAEDIELRPASALVTTNDNVDPMNTQVGGSHYQGMAIQPLEYILANDLPFVEGSVVKYVSRWKLKGGVEDLKKARHLLDTLIQHEETAFAA